MNDKEINRLYVACRERFDERYSDLRTVKDDKTFLADALECEICANAITLCLEFHYGWTDSPAAATSCRAILEAKALLKMVLAGELEDDQIANFKHQSALLFYGNIFDTAENEKDRLFNDERAEMLRQQIDWIVRDYDRAVEAYRSKYGDGFDERAQRDSIREGLFFARKTAGDKKKTFTKLFRKHMLDVDKTGQLYERVSFFAHPWYLDSIADSQKTDEARARDMELCLEVAKEMVANEIGTLPDCPTSIDEDVDKTGAYLGRSNEISSLCDRLGRLCLGDEKRSSYPRACLRRLGPILAEMNILIGLGYYEMALSKFQSVCEFWGMFVLINSTENPAEMRAIQTMFDHSSRMQLGKFGLPYSELPKKDPESLNHAFSKGSFREGILFDNYIKKIAKNSLAFLDIFQSKKGMCFMDIVRSSADVALSSSNPVWKENYILGYLFSVDVHHATGFCYTENRDCWKLLSHSSLAGIYGALWQFCQMAGISADGVFLLCRLFAKRLEDLMIGERQQVQDLSLKYPA